MTSWSGSSEDRFDYLQTLVTEFQDSDSPEAKLQVLANLANFAFDPINGEQLMTLQVHQLFLDAMTAGDHASQEFGMGGLCNLSLDPRCRALLLQQEDAVALVTRCLSSEREETVLSAITALMQLTTGPPAQGVVLCMLRLSVSDSPRLRTLSTLFLDDCCSRLQVDAARTAIATGTPSPQGPTGTPSPQGPTGTPSPQGATGTPSPQGATGTPSPQGATGTLSQHGGSPTS